MSVTKFLAEVREELAKVVWPTRNQTMRLTLIVLGVSLTVALYLGLVDAILSAILNRTIYG